MIKFVLWVVVMGVAVGAESLTLMWVSSAAHDWWPLVPVMDFGSAVGVGVALSVAVTVWKAAESFIRAVSDL